MDILNEEFLFFLRCAQNNGLRYLLIGGYAVNFYGYNRNTADMDIWLAPDKKNQAAFVETLLCMKYSEEEVSPLKQEDFTKPFVGTIGSADSIIDVLTYVDKTLNFDEAEKEKERYEIEAGTFLNVVSYKYLIEMKLKALRDKDLLDVSKLEELRKLK